MKKNIFFSFLFSLVATISFAQEDATVAEQKDYPVNGAFESGYLIDAQTTIIPNKKTLEFVIHHKFGTIDGGSTDLWGLYKSANVRLGLNYVPYKNIQIGAGITKSYMTTDLNMKWTILQQTRKNTIPVSVALYGNVAIDGRPLENYSNDSVRQAYTGPVGEIKFSDRLSYFSQLIVGRKFNDRLTLQAGASFSHYNLVEEGFDHDKVGVHLNGRFKVSNQGSIIFNYDQPLKIKNISEQVDWTTAPEPNIAFGYEISTGTHAFQIFMSTSGSILPQEGMLFNSRKFDKNGLSLGFVMTRLWGF